MLQEHDLYEILIKTANYKKIKSYLKKDTSFAFASQNNLSKLISANFISREKNIVIVTETGQSALKYRNDFKESINGKSESIISGRNELSRICLSAWGEFI